LSLARNPPRAERQHPRTEGARTDMQVFHRRLYAAFQKFQTLFDGEMTGFMEAAGVASSEELFQRMEEETNQSERATKFFSQLMASMEYNSFCNLARQFQSAAEWEDSEESDDPD